MAATMEVLNEWAEGCKAVSVDWQEQVLECTDGYDRDCSPSESAKVLREFIKHLLIKLSSQYITSA